MSRHKLRSIPFDSDRATFEDYEARVEARELDRWLEEHEPDDEDDT